MIISIIDFDVNCNLHQRHVGDIPGKYPAKFNDHNRAAEYLEEFEAAACGLEIAQMNRASGASSHLPSLGRRSPSSCSSVLHAKATSRQHGS